MFTTVSEENIFPMVNVNGQQVMCLCLCFIPALCVYTWKIILGVGPLFAGPGLLPLQEDPSRQDGKVSSFLSSPQSFSENHRHPHRSSLAFVACMPICE